MALSQRLDIKLGQSLVMTPQLQQAIKLLQMSNIELQSFVEEELERNPLLERDERSEIKEVRDLTRMVAESAVGKKVEIELIRKGETKTVSVTLGRLEDGEKQMTENGDTPDNPDKPVETKVLGMTIGELTDEARKANGIADDIKGVLITDVAADSAAAEKQVQKGEVITEVAQELVTSPKDFSEKIEKLKKEGRKNALLMVASKTGELRFLTLRIE